MDEDTRQALLSINKRFYDDYSDSFGASRQRPWPAWQTLLGDPNSPGQGSSDEPLKILDVGCGNGRFGALVTSLVDRPVHYVGVDHSAGLLDQARVDLSSRVERLRLEQLDLGDADARPPELKGGFDIIGIFGVLHHLPGESHRRGLLNRLGSRLAPGGQLWASWWMLHQTSRFEKKVVPWHRLREEKPPLAMPDPDLLEQGDTLLSWQRDGFGLRYLHFPSGPEIDRLQRLENLDFVRTLESDGPTGRETLYLVWTC